MRTPGPRTPGATSRRRSTPTPVHAGTSASPCGRSRPGGRRSGRCASRYRLLRLTDTPGRLLSSARGAGRPSRTRGSGTGFEARDQAFDWRELPQVDPPKQCHLEVEPGLGRGADFGLCLDKQIERAQQVFARKTAGQRFEAIALDFAGDFRIRDPRRVDAQHPAESQHHPVEGRASDDLLGLDLVGAVRDPMPSSVRPREAVR